jgi:Uma2 family endonuclease
MDQLRRLVTTAEFLQERPDLPEAGQWAELERGRVVLLQPPDLDHGNTLLNLSKAIAAWTHSPLAGDTYACFDLGLILHRDPDTIRFPAVTFFSGGRRFAESDREATETVPILVVELATSAERRQAMPQRVADYLAWGVAEVWVIDPRAQSLIQHVGSGRPIVRTDRDEVRDVAPLPGFHLAVADLFVEPEWWLGRPRRPESLPGRGPATP